MVRKVRLLLGRKGEIKIKGEKLLSGKGRSVTNSKKGKDLYLKEYRKVKIKDLLYFKVN